ncbi:MAG: class I SAM-dependent methyltransferase [Pseudomonadales bacterium]
MQKYSEEPEDQQAFTEGFDRFYTRFAGVYDLLVKVFPIWKRWLRRAVPHLIGPRILEVSFGTGWLMTQYADRFEVHGVDLNNRMVEVAQENLAKSGLSAELQQGNVESLPISDERFDTVLCTMALSGYPNAQRALTEMLRVLKPEGRIVLIDVNYPANENWFGTFLTRFWIRSGDLVRDMGSLFENNQLAYSDEEIGGWGSIHLYIVSLRSAASSNSTPN